VIQFMPHDIGFVSIQTACTRVRLVIEIVVMLLAPPLHLDQVAPYKSAFGWHPTANTKLACGKPPL
jgi:hypothetical protein